MHEGKFGTTWIKTCNYLDPENRTFSLVHLSPRCKRHAVTQWMNVRGRCPHNGRGSKLTRAAVEQLNQDRVTAVSSPNEQLSLLMITNCGGCGRRVAVACLRDLFKFND